MVKELYFLHLRKGFSKEEIDCLENDISFVKVFEDSNILVISDIHGLERNKDKISRKLSLLYDKGFECIAYTVSYDISSKCLSKDFIHDEISYKLSSNFKNVLQSKYRGRYNSIRLATKSENTHLINLSDNCLKWLVYLSEFSSDSVRLISELFAEALFLFSPISSEMQDELFESIFYYLFSGLTKCRVTKLIKRISSDEPIRNSDIVDWCVDGLVEDVSCSDNLTFKILGSLYDCYNFINSNGKHNMYFEIVIDKGNHYDTDLLSADCSLSLIQHSSEDFKPSEYCICFIDVTFDNGKVIDIRVKKNKDSDKAIILSSEDIATVIGIGMHMQNSHCLISARYYNSSLSYITFWFMKLQQFMSNIDATTFIEMVKCITARIVAETLECKCIEAIDDLDSNEHVCRDYLCDMANTGVFKTIQKTKASDIIITFNDESESTILVSSNLVADDLKGSDWSHIRLI